MKNCRKCKIELYESNKIKAANICKNCQLEYQRDYYKKNRNKWYVYYGYNNLTDDQKKEKYKKRKEKIDHVGYIKYQSEYREKNKEVLREKRRQYQKNVRYPRHLERMRTDEKYRATRAYRSLLRNFIQRSKNSYIKNEKTSQILGYSMIEFKSHIESLFLPGMTWFNHGEWHLDHISPISSFELGTPVNIFNALNNLQPLWAYDNLKKVTKYEKL